MKPVGWTETSAHVWSKDFGDFTLQSHGIGGFIGEWTFSPEFEIRDNSKPVAVEAAELHSKSGVYPAKIREENRVVPANCRQGCKLGVEWEFDSEHAAPEILGDHSEIVLKLKVGWESREARVEFQSY
jgi:hypothetical protein